MTPANEPYYDGVHPYPVAPPKPANWRSQAGKIGANSRWAQESDRSAATQPARDGLIRKFENEVDPDRTLPVDERAKRVENARRAYYQRLALKSAQSRRAKKDQR